jgi:chromosome partitioning protein
VARNARIIAIENQKGGVGKTTTAVNLAASLAVLEKQVLLVDLDPQGAVAACFGLKRGDVAGGMYEVFVKGENIQQYVMKVGRVAVGVVPANIWTDDQEEAYTLAIRPEILVRAIEQLRPHFDYVLIDNPPSIGPITVAAMAAADSLLIPVQCENLAVLAVGKILRLMRKVKSTLNPRLELEGVVVTMPDSRTTLTTENMNTLWRTFGDYLLRPPVPRTVDLARAVARGEPLLYHNARSGGAQAYLYLAGELMRRAHQGDAA